MQVKLFTVGEWFPGLLLGYEWMVWGMRGKNFCRGCNSQSLFEALDLGFSPLANNVLTREGLESPEPWYPLVLRVCESCGLGQLGEFAGETEIFREYPYLSSTSSTWLDSNRSFAEGVVDLLKISKDDMVLELASNDGYLLKYFVEKGIRVLGIEPALNVATLAALGGIPTSPEFFSENVANRLSQKGVIPRLIVAKNVLAHVPNIRDFIAGVSKICDSQTLVVIEAPSILNILQGMQFDTVYQEHFSYLSATFFQNILKDFNLRLIGSEEVQTHGGSMRLYVASQNTSIILPTEYESGLQALLKREKESGFIQPESWKNLRSKVMKLLEEFRDWISSREGRVVGYGAAAKGVTLLSSAQVPRGSLGLCIDNSEAKVGRFIPGSHAEIVSETDYVENHFRANDTFLIFPWNLEKEISARIRTFSPNASIYVALPSLREV